MSDLQQGAAPTGPNTGQPERTSQPQEAQTTPAPAAQDRPAKVNLYELDEFKNVQRSWQQTIEQERQARLQMQQQLDQLQTQGMDDYERAKWELQRERQARTQAEQQARQYQEYLDLMEQRKSRLDKMAEKYGVPRYELESAADPDDAMEKVIQLRERQAFAKQQQQQTQELNQDIRREANRPDLGGGSAPARGEDDAYRRAVEARDSVALVRAAWDSGWKD